jgi:hypothetical protein
MGMKGFLKKVLPCLSQSVGSTAALSGCFTGGIENPEMKTVYKTFRDFACLI